ncbi:hypothetical protein TNCV_3224061 [Trichonephila clavipes]|nr:hypothetical protein TNCV_3224061 [Trichonephila clavipes]
MGDRCKELSEHDRKHAVLRCFEKDDITETSKIGFVVACLHAAQAREVTIMVAAQTVHDAPDIVTLFLWIFVILQSSPPPDSRSMLNALPLV